MNDILWYATALRGHLIFLITNLNTTYKCLAVIYQKSLMFPAWTFLVHYTQLQTAHPPVTLSLLLQQKVIAYQSNNTVTERLKPW
jgi:hypothetical protein